MAKKSKHKKFGIYDVEDSYDATDDEIYDEDDSIPNRHMDGELSDEELLSYPPMMLGYKSYEDASKAERKKERKRRKKMYHLTDDEIEDIYEAMGGRAQAKEFAQHIRDYVKEVDDWLIIKDETTTVINRCMDIALQGAEDLEKGVPWIIRYDNLMAYADRMAEFNGR